MHGPRLSRCEGSGKAPYKLLNEDSNIALPVGQETIEANFAQPWLDPLPPMIKWIPKSARRPCASLLTSLIREVLNNPQDISCWSKLLLFGRQVLARPSSDQGKQRLSSIITKRCAEFSCILSGTTTKQNKRVYKSSYKRKSSDDMLSHEVSLKLEEGNYKGAVRRLCSEDVIAANKNAAFTELKLKHPPVPSDRKDAVLPEASTPLLIVTENEINSLIQSFPVGSSGGLDGLTPQHLKDLIKIEGESSSLLQSVTHFVNFILKGDIPSIIRPVFFGGRLIALTKKDGGIRPIVIGNLLRRLCAKAANNFAKKSLATYFGQKQVVVGISGGMEAAVHATHRYLLHLPEGHAICKLDFKNAFNSVRRDVVLNSVHQHVPEIYPFVYASYASASSLVYDCKIIDSSEGIQQGDPLGPLLFCLAIHPILQNCHSELCIGYLDDVTLGGPIDSITRDINRFRTDGLERGLELNDKKCELICSQMTSLDSGTLDQFKFVKADEATLLGSPLSIGKATDDMLKSKIDILSILAGRLNLLQAHDALTILRHSLSLPALLHILRTSLRCKNQYLREFDETLRTCLSGILNVSLDDASWLQATMPVKEGGLGLRRSEQIAPSAFLSSVASTAVLVSLMLPDPIKSIQDDRLHDALACWQSFGGSNALTDDFAKKQKNWDSVIISNDKNRLLQVADETSKARILATMSPHAGDWLLAPPLTSVGLRMDNNTIRVAVALRLGAPVCAPHICTCGSAVNALGIHGLSCIYSAGRSLRHSLLNNIVHKALVRAQIPSVLEPNGMFPGSGLRPDGATLVPWSQGRCLIWDATVPDTLAASHLQATATSSGGAAESSAQLKIRKYHALAGTHIIMPVSVETFGSWAIESFSFIKELGRRLFIISGDKRETSYLFQRLSVAVQRGNAISCLGSLPK
jgi:hypothetical protein